MQIVDPSVSTYVLKIISIKRKENQRLQHDFDEFFHYEKTFETVNGGIKIFLIQDKIYLALICLTWNRCVRTR